MKFSFTDTRCVCTVLSIVHICLLCRQQQLLRWVCLRILRSTRVTVHCSEAQDTTEHSSKQSHRVHMAFTASHSPAINWHWNLAVRRWQSTSLFPSIVKENTVNFTSHQPRSGLYSTQHHCVEGMHRSYCTHTVRVNCIRTIWVRRIWASWMNHSHSSHFSIKSNHSFPPNLNHYRNIYRPIFFLCF